MKAQETQIEIERSEAQTQIFLEQNDAEIQVKEEQKEMSTQLCAEQVHVEIQAIIKNETRDSYCQFTKILTKNSKSQTISTEPDEFELEAAKSAAGKSDTTAETSKNDGNDVEC